MSVIKRISAFLLALILALALCACDILEADVLFSPPTSQSPAATTSEPSAPPETDTPAPTPAVSEDGWYDSREEVALYLHLYGRLPDNYVTKEEAEAKGWTGGSVERYTGEGTAIGGSRFGNYEGLLPKAQGRTYTECDIGTVGKSSGGPSGWCTPTTA